MILCGDCIEILKSIPEKSIDMCFTSPNPVFYMYKKQKNSNDRRMVGTETHSYQYVNHLIDIFSEVKRVLKDNGSCFVQLGDWYDHEGSLRCIPELFSLLMTNEENQWYLSGKIIWHRPMDYKDAKQQTTGFIKDWEYCYQFTKDPHNFHFNNKDNRLWTRSVFSFKNKPVMENEFDSGFPEELVEIAIKTTVPKGGVVLDPMAGSGVTGVVTKKLGRQFILIDINREKCLAMGARLGCQVR
jgi:site-specific DNA-methyltransferase (cytosine-N4-specific)